MRPLGAEAGSECRQWSQSPEEQRAGLGAWGAGHWRPSCPRRGPFAAKGPGQEETQVQPGGEGMLHLDSLDLGAGEGGEGTAAS